MNSTVVIEVVVVVVVIVGGRIVAANSLDWTGRELSQILSGLVDWKLEVYIVISGGGGVYADAERPPGGCRYIWRLPL